jgi:hypothetical protein
MVIGAEAQIYDSKAAALGGRPGGREFKVARMEVESDEAFPFTSSQSTVEPWSLQSRPIHRSAPGGRRRPRCHAPQ